MASSVDNKNLSASGLAASCRGLNQQWAPYLTEKHYKVLDRCMEIIDQMSQNMDSMDMSQLVPALQQLEVFHKRAQKRQAEIALINDFIKECDTTLAQLKEHRLRLIQMEPQQTDNNSASASKMQVCLKCTDQYSAFLSDLKKLAVQTLAAFSEKKFDKGVRALYPQMLKDLGLLLKKADLLKEIQSMPDSLIKKDLLSVLQNSNVKLQVPNKDQFNAADWVLVLKGFSGGARKLLVTDEMLKSEGNANDETISKLEKAVSNTSQFLSNLISTCQKKSEGYAQQKADCEQIVLLCQDPKKPESLKKYEQELIAHAGICANYFSGLKNLMEQTQAAFEKGGVAGVGAVYPQMVQDLAELLKKAKLLKLVEEMPKHFLKDHLQAALRNEQIPSDVNNINEWIYGLLGFQGQGEHALSQNLPADPEISSLADKVDQVVKFPNSEDKV